MGYQIIEKWRTNGSKIEHTTEMPNQTELTNTQTVQYSPSNMEGGINRETVSLVAAENESLKHGQMCQVPNRTPLAKI